MITFFHLSQWKLNDTVTNISFFYCSESITPATKNKHSLNFQSVTRYMQRSTYHLIFVCFSKYSHINMRCIAKNLYFNIAPSSHFVCLFLSLFFYLSTRRTATKFTFHTHNTHWSHQTQPNTSFVSFLFQQHVRIWMLMNKMHKKKYKNEGTTQKILNQITNNVQTCFTCVLSKC